MKSYLSYFKIRFMANLQYRADAIAGICTQLFFGFVYIMVYLAFYESGGNNIPMNWQELVNYMWLQQAFFALIFPVDTDQELISMIRNGNVAYEIIRPQNFYFKWYIKALSKRIVNVLLRAWFVIIVAILLPYPFRLSMPISLEAFIMFTVSLILACLLVTSLNLIILILTMFTLDEKGTLNIYMTISTVFMGSIIPLPFLPIWLKKISDVLPFRFIGDFPFRVYSGSISVSSGYTMIVGSLIWIIICILVGELISKLALKKAVIQGG